MGSWGFGVLGFGFRVECSGLSGRGGLECRI